MFTITFAPCNECFAGDRIHWVAPMVAQLVEHADIRPPVFFLTPPASDYLSCVFRELSMS